MEKLNKMQVQELDELLRLVNGIIHKYQDTLTTYAKLNNDSSFEKITVTEKAKFDKMNQFVRLKQMIETELEEKIYEAYIK